jgi:hypothetical protein
MSFCSLNSLLNLGGGQTQFYSTGKKAACGCMEDQGLHEQSQPRRDCCHESMIPEQDKRQNRGRNDSIAAKHIPYLLLNLRTDFSSQASSKQIQITLWVQYGLSTQQPGYCWRTSTQAF